MLFEFYRRPIQDTAVRFFYRARVDGQPPQDWSFYGISLATLFAAGYSHNDTLPALRDFLAKDHQIPLGEVVLLEMDIVPKLS
jgi:hypothetical protein